MKLYSTGLMGFIATVASLVACIEVNQNFNITYPFVLIVVIGVTEIYLTRKRAGLIREGEWYL